METLVNAVKVGDDDTLKFKPNPKRPGFKAHARYEAYQNATTLEEYLKLNEGKYARPDLRYDEEHGHLEIYNADGELKNPRPEE